MALAAASEDRQDFAAAEDHFNAALAVVCNLSSSTEHLRAYRLFAAFLRRRGREQQAAILDKIADVHQQKQKNVSL